LGTFSSFFSAAESGGSNPRTSWQFQNTDTLNIGFNPTGSAWFESFTNAVFRDPAAWYHIVISVDMTQATSTDRLKVYVNGVAQTFSTYSVPAQNTDLPINNNWAHSIARYQAGASDYFDGYLTEVNFIDGQALTPTSFGTTNSYGVWQPITYGGSYGTNGFYLPFTPTAPVGTPSTSVSYLVVAGGGGGGQTQTEGGGGGGAGGFRTGSALSLTGGSSYTVTVGAGGAKGTWSPNNNGANGSDSIFSTITSSGGGKQATAGGSGGGGISVNANQGAGNTPSTSPSQGNSGGGGNGGWFNGGGGGGAGSAGFISTGSAGGAGGSGSASSISGTSVTYAGGGGGGAYQYNGGAGGSGGGGNGGTVPGPGQNGGTNLGGGGGGGAYQAPATQQDGGNGGSGIVIVSYAGSVRFTGGTVTTSGGNTIHTFTTSGILTYNIASDVSPNANNWTANNISLDAGSTYDSMTDVPTLTSATAANYAVSNVLDIDRADITTSNGNLTLTKATANNSPRAAATFGATSGKFYAEITWTSITNTTPNDNYVVTGVTTKENWTDSSNGYNAILYLAANNGLAANGQKGIWTAGSFAASSYGSGYFVSGSVIGIALNLDAGTVTFYLNNVSQGAITLPTTTQPWFFYNTSDGTGNGYTANWNFGQQPWTYTPPANFVALNTYNL
jgi:hypothetical protein